jgi:hypothetical protein
VANNTVAIILSGDMAREVAKEYGVDPNVQPLCSTSFHVLYKGLFPMVHSFYWPAQLQSFRQLNSSAAFTTVGYWQSLPSLRLHSVFHD